MTKFNFICLILLMTALPCFNVHAESYSCEGGIISTNDRSSDVRAKCGRPDSIDSHQEEVIQQSDDTRQKVYINVEEWSYNFGPTQFTRLIVLKNGVVTEIKTGSYGYIK